MWWHIRNSIHFNCIADIVIQFEYSKSPHNIALSFAIEVLCSICVVSQPWWNTPGCKIIGRYNTTMIKHCQNMKYRWAARLLIVLHIVKWFAIYNSIQLNPGSRCCSFSGMSKLHLLNFKVHHQTELFLNIERSNPISFVKLPFQHLSYRLVRQVVNWKGACFGEVHLSQLLCFHYHCH